MRYFISVVAIILSAWLTPPAFAADRDEHECKHAKDANRQIATCTRLIESGRADWSVYQYRAMGYMGKKAWSLAIADITEAIRLNPESNFLYIMRGDFLTRNGDYGLAIADLTKAIRLHAVTPDSGFDYFMLGNAYLAKGDYDLAIADFTEAIRRRQTNFRYYEARSKAHKAKGDTARALADHQEALRLNPNFVGDR